jgi:hypothetical protein
MQATVMEKFMRRKHGCHVFTQGAGAKEGGEAIEALCRAS